MYQQDNANDFHDSEYVNTLRSSALIKAEKREIRNAAFTIGFSLLAVMIIKRVWAFGYMFFMERLGFTAQKAYEIITNPAVLQAVQVILSLVMFTVPFVIATRVSSRRVGEIVPLERVKSPVFAAFFLVGIAFCAFSNIATSIAGGIFESFGFNYEVTHNEEPNGIFGFLLCVLATVVIPAAVEEFACRGVMQGLLLRFGEAFSIIVSAILFGIMHGNFQQAPFAFIIGLALGFIRIKTGSLWVCVSVHAANNFVSVAMSFLTKSMSETVTNLIYGIYLLVALLCLSFGVLLLSKSDTDFLHLKKAPETECREAQKYRWFFTAFPVIMVIIICLIDAISYF